MTDDQDAYRAAVQASYAPLKDYVQAEPESIAKQFLGALYPKVLAIAVRKRSTVVVVARDIIRKDLEGCA